MVTANLCPQVASITENGGGSNYPCACPQLTKQLHTFLCKCRFALAQAVLSTGTGTQQNLWLAASASPFHNKAGCASMGHVTSRQRWIELVPADIDVARSLQIWPRGACLWI